jgi:hypothetical protein
MLEMPLNACSLLLRRSCDTSTLVEFASWRSLLEQPTRALHSSSSCTVDVSKMCCGRFEANLIRAWQNSRCGIYTAEWVQGIQSPLYLACGPGRSESGRLQHASEFAPLEASWGGGPGAKATTPQVRDLIQQRPTRSPSRVRSYLEIFCSYLSNSYGLYVKSPRLQQPRAVLGQCVILLSK